MSGHALTVPPQSPSVVDSVVTAPLLEKLGITRGENEEWKRQLREVPVDRIIQAQIELGINALFPSDEILPEGINLYKLPEWLETVMIGDTAYEGCLWSKAVAELSSVEGLLQMFPDTAAAEKIRAAYGIQPYVEFDELRRKVLSFIGDVKFGFHTEQLYQTFRQQRKNVLRYHMDAINPYDEKAGAHHCVDLIYLFRHEGEVAERMREIWIRFAYGLDSEEMIVLGERKGRREGMYRVLREVSESDLAQVTRAVTGGRIAFDVVDI